MLTLAIDTSDEVSVVALGSDGKMLAEYHFHSKMTLLKRLVPNIHRVLTDCGRTVRELAGVVVALGPGSFTGLRIGVTTAKSLAHTLEVPIVGVGTLDAIAYSCAPVSEELICPLIHARSGEAYYSFFDASGEVRLADPDVGPLSSVLEKAAHRGGSVFFCGSGALRNAEAIRHRFGLSAVVGPAWTAFSRGAALIEQGDKLLRAGAVDEAVSLVPLYIRKPTPLLRLETGQTP